MNFTNGRRWLSNSFHQHHSQVRQKLKNKVTSSLSPSAISCLPYSNVAICCCAFSTNSFDPVLPKTLESVSCNISSNIDNFQGPFGSLFVNRTELGSGLVGKIGCINRTFGPRDNTDAILATGGEALAAHSSFDPDYKRAKGWIRQHAVGPAVLSPILLQGLIGSLSEAAFPEGVLISQSMTQLKPLIVGVAVKAVIEVENVEHSTKTLNEEADEKNGYMVFLRTNVSRIRDNEIIVEGMKIVWIPDYENM